MFKLNENHEIDRKILKCGYVRYSSAKTSTIDTPNSEICINIPEEDGVVSLLYSYLGLKLSIKQIIPDMETVMI